MSWKKMKKIGESRLERTLIVFIFPKIRKEKTKIWWVNEGIIRVNLLKKLPITLLRMTAQIKSLTYNSSFTIFHSHKPSETNLLFSFMRNNFFLFYFNFHHVDDVGKQHLEFNLSFGKKYYKIKNNKLIIFHPIKLEKKFQNLSWKRIIKTGSPLPTKNGKTGGFGANSSPVGRSLCVFGFFF